MWPDEWTIIHVICFCTRLNVWVDTCTGIAKVACCCKGFQFNWTSDAVRLCYRRMWVIYSLNTPMAIIFCWVMAIWSSMGPILNDVVLRVSASLLEPCETDFCHTFELRILVVNSSLEGCLCMPTCWSCLREHLLKRRWQMDLLTDWPTNQLIDWLIDWYAGSGLCEIMCWRYRELWPFNIGVNVNCKRLDAIHSRWRRSVVGGVCWKYSVTDEEVMVRSRQEWVENILRQNILKKTLLAWTCVLLTNHKCMSQQSIIVEDCRVQDRTR